MKKTFALLFATSLLASAPAFAWDPAAPARGVVDTFVDKCPRDAPPAHPSPAIASKPRAGPVRIQ